MELRVDTRQIEALGALFARAPEITATELYVSVVEADLLVQGELQQSLPRGAGGMRGGGGLAGSVFTDEQKFDDNVVGLVATQLPYAEAVEVGTRPHMPPVQPIADWVAAKFGEQGPEGVRIAWAIAKTIAAKGTKPNPVWQRTAERMLPEIQRKIAEAVVRITGRLAPA